MKTISTADAVLKLTGPAVLLHIAHKTKIPTSKGWQKLTQEDCTPEYLSRLTQNIGVSLGTTSGGLYTIDCDTDEAFCEMLDYNPQMHETLHSHGVRGGNFWVRISGEVPKSGKLKTLNGASVGEWRGDGNQTLIQGTHPEGVAYSNNGKKVATIEFSELKWPKDWKLPWKKDTITNEPKEKGGGDVKFSRDLLRGIKGMLNSIPPRPDRDTWLRVSAAVRNSLGNEGDAIEILKNWSPEEVEGEYAKLLETQFSEINIGTLAHHAKEYGFRGLVCLFFYDGKGFFMESSSGDFIRLNGESAVRQHLGQMGVLSKYANGILCAIREKQNVDLVSEVAGKERGLHVFQGSRILVTKGPSVTPAVPGNDTFIDDFFTQLLDDPAHPEQLQTFLDWLAHSRNAVIKGRRMQTPAMALAGDRADGKSLAIEIINRCLGRRAAQAYRYFSGNTQFNADLIRAELLTIDDAAAARDRGSRAELAQRLKTEFFAGSMRIEGKGVNAVNCAPVHTLIFAVNKDPEHLRVLPVLDDSMKDKISLLITRRVDLGSLAGNFPETSDRVDRALPAFLNRLEKRDLSKSYGREGRLHCFWHPGLIEKLNDLSDENRLLSLIRECVLQRYLLAQGEPLHLGHNPPPPTGIWEGEAIRLETLLTDHHSPVVAQARTLLKYGNTCGTLLGRLADQNGIGVERGGLCRETRVQMYKINIDSMI